MAEKSYRRITRRNTNIWLVGDCFDENLPRNGKLPTLREVLKRFFARLHSTPGTAKSKDVARHTGSALLEFWAEANIPTQNARDVIKKLLNVYREYRRLGKDKGLKCRKSDMKRQLFTSKLDRLPDIGHKKAMELIKIDDDRQFYVSMQSDRIGYMGGIDKEWCAMQENNRKRNHQKELAAEKAKERSTKETNELFKNHVSSEASDTSTAEDTDDDFTPSKPKKRKIHIVNDSMVSAALDRTLTSSGGGSMLIKAVAQATAKSLGFAEKEVQIVSSRSQLHRKRSECREEMAIMIKQEFTPDVPLVVHWDGKLMPSSEDAEGNADRLPILVSGEGVEQLLGVPELKRGTGIQEATAVVEYLTSWELQERVIGLVFDITTVNSGRVNGACVHIQRKLGKELLELACRHHILELVLAAVFDSLISVSKKATLPFVDCLKDNWKNIDKARYRTAATTRGSLRKINDKKEIIIFCCNQLKVFQPRDDYRELLELVIIFLGGSVPGTTAYQFKKPGSISKSRWMAKAIYSFKVWMFGKQLNLSTKESDNVFQICCFVASVYIKSWYTCPVAFSAPARDLELLKTLASREEKHYQAALKKFCNHLWYLSETLVCLSLFDPNVSLPCKRAMVNSYLKEVHVCSPRAQLPPNCGIKDLELSDFVSSNSRRFFD
ncbi:uncharacterized protein LOC124154192 [Ischnura elegans]|uniref:uncharacterized protein LOC124154192 n=1 Tax=Ischnura elegans TaxID=197161 RepID=UPI001ED8BFD9|nr:uncharacterized protein LOC124154192 [Ischnura elegans]